MMVLVTTAVSTGLRGELTRWLLEVSPGVFVGTVSSTSSRSDLGVYLREYW